MRVRWALEEVGQPYAVRPLSFAALKEPAYRRLQPFGQIPAFQDGDLVLFESSAIVLHLAERYSGLLPSEATARARAMAWMFAALNTIEPPIVEREIATYVDRYQPWFEARLPILKDRIRTRLDELAIWLADGGWLEGSFSAGDLLMVTVLRRLHGSPLLEDHPSLCAYVARAEARPAYQRAFADQLKAFQTAPTGD